MKTQHLAALLGFALAIVAAVFLLAGVSRDGIDCGSALNGNDKAEIADISQGYANAENFGIIGADGHAQADCDSARSSRSTLALALGIPGLVLLLGGGYVILAEGVKRADAAREAETSGG